MKIMATVDYGRAQVTQSWELMDSATPFLIIHETKQGILVIKLDKDKIQKMSGMEQADANYLGTVKASDAFLMQHG